MSILYEAWEIAVFFFIFIYFFWIKNHATDHEPPKIANCPNDIHKTSKQKLTQVFFPGVIVTDNVAVHLFTTSRPNGSEFTWGEHNMTYTASDKAGNIAKCHFQIIIVGMYSRFKGFLKRFETRRRNTTIFNNCRLQGTLLFTSITIYFVIWFHAE